MTSPSDHNMSNPLEAAQQDLARIDAQIAKLQAQRAEVQAWVDRYHKYAGGQPASVKMGTRIHKKDLIGDAAADIIGRHGNYVELSPLADAISARGIEIGGEDPKQRLSSIMNRDGRFQAVRGRGWTLKETPEELMKRLSLHVGQSGRDLLA